MASQRFRAVIAAGPRDSAAIMVPFDPDEAWGAKADHPVSGTIGGCRIRTRLVPADRGWALTLAAKRLTGMGIAIGDEVSVELGPEGPQRGDLADAGCRCDHRRPPRWQPHWQPRPDAPAVMCSHAAASVCQHLRSLLGLRSG